jgi:RsmE family RNA methyltransferase
MQSNRPDIPRVEQVRKFPVLLSGLSNPPRANPEKMNTRPGEGGGSISGETLLLLPWEEGTEPIKNVLRSNLHQKNILVIIGPEGGLSVKEADTARDKGFHLVSLGQNILRTETAALAVLSMIQYEFMS